MSVRFTWVLIFAAAFTSAQPGRVDFRNFSYPFEGKSGWNNQLVWLEPSKRNNVQLVNGRWRWIEDGETLDRDARFAGLTLESVQFADLTGDGRREAIIILRFDTGGTQYSHFVYVYDLPRTAKPHLLAYFQTGDRAYSGLYNTYSQKGMLIVELFDPDKSEGDCCSSGFIRTRYKWRGTKFEKVGRPEHGRAKAESRLPVTVFGNHAQ